MDNETQQQPQQKSKVMPAVLLGVLALVVIVGIAIFAFNSAKKDDMSAMNDSTAMQQSNPTDTQTAAPSESASSSDVQGAEAQAFTVQGGNFYFKPNEIRVKKGTHVKIIFKNDGGFHDFVLDAFNVRTPNVPSGGTATVEFTADKTGTFEYYCSVGNHRQMGMRGNLIVE